MSWFQSLRLRVFLRLHLLSRVSQLISSFSGSVDLRVSQNRGESRTKIAKIRPIHVDITRKRRRHGIIGNVTVMEWCFCDLGDALDIILTVVTWVMFIPSQCLHDVLYIIVSFQWRFLHHCLVMCSGSTDTSHRMSWSKEKQSLSFLRQGYFGWQWILPSTCKKWRRSSCKKSAIGMQKL